MFANSEGCVETARMRRLAWAFAGRLCDKYQNLMSWLIWYGLNTTILIGSFGWSATIDDPLLSNLLYFQIWSLNIIYFNLLLYFEYFFFRFIPFSVGKRRCPGQNFAMSRTFVIFTSLLQQIHFLPPNEEELPSADPRLYTTKYPLYLPLFKCKAVQRTSWHFMIFCTTESAILYWFQDPGRVFAG